MHVPGLFLRILLPVILALSAAASPLNELRVMSFNIRYGTAKDGPDHWDLRKKFLADTIRTFDPDLLGTQETLAFQRDYLKEQLTGMTAWGVGRDDGSEKGEMSLLLYRDARFERIGGGHFWLSETPDKPGSMSWDSSLPRMVSWVRLKDRRIADAPAILFLNTHFDHKGSQARLESARLLRDKITELGQGCRVVLTGDFNTGEGSEPHTALFAASPNGESPLIDAYRIANPKRADNEGTFNGFKPDATAGARIDWIGVSRHWTITEILIDRTTRDGRTPSDHFPVNARIAPR